jgi:hypothetical protein
MPFLEYRGKIIFINYSLYIFVSIVEMVIYLRSLARRGAFSGLLLKVDDFW